MDKKGAFIGIVVLVLAMAGFYWWFTTSIPSQAEIEQATAPIQTVEKDLLKSKETQSILKRDVNGNVPVTVNKDDLGRDDPFANY